VFDPDTDGDGVPDGWDDQDHDDVSNIEEMRNGTWAMNPCDPVVSRTCPRWLDDAQTPRMPANLCTSRTIMAGGVIKWFNDGGGGSSDGRPCPTYP
jgi:hypothetical protein